MYVVNHDMKPFVIGRKNGLFSSTINIATTLAIIYCIILVAIANEFVPQKYLEHIHTNTVCKDGVIIFLCQSRYLNVVNRKALSRSNVTFTESFYVSLNGRLRITIFSFKYRAFVTIFRNKTFTTNSGICTF